MVYSSISREEEIWIIYRIILPDALECLHTFRGKGLWLINIKYRPLYSTIPRMEKMGGREMTINERDEKMIEHHTKYREIHGVDETVWMTRSEHILLHKKLRGEGKCNVTPSKLKSISIAAYGRTLKRKELMKKNHLAHKTERNQRGKENYQNNREKILEEKKKYYEENKEKIQKHNKKYYEKHKEQDKEYRKKNKERIQKYQKEYRERKKKEKEMI